jgi:hypothetical protein
MNKPTYEELAEIIRRIADEGYHNDGIDDDSCIPAKTLDDAITLAMRLEEITD